jgi:hypothetical protein
VIDLHENQRRLFEGSSGLAEKRGRGIGLYTVALLSVTGAGRSAAILWVRVTSHGGHSAYILVAAHVREMFENAPGIGLTLASDANATLQMIYSAEDPPRQRSSWGPQAKSMDLERE